VRLVFQTSAIFVDDDAFAALPFFSHIIKQHWATVFAEVIALRGKFFRQFVRDVARGPYLAVRVRVGTPHDLAFVLKDLHVMDEVQ